MLDSPHSIGTVCGGSCCISGSEGFIDIASYVEAINNYPSDCYLSVVRNCLLGYRHSTLILGPTIVTMIPRFDNFTPNVC